VGLASSGGIVEQHGRIALESAAGEDTTVAITLLETAGDQCSAAG